MLTLLAHQGGWDEVLLVAAPIVLFGVLLAVANRHDPSDGSGDRAERGSHDGLPDLGRVEDPDGHGDAPGR